VILLSIIKTNLRKTSFLQFGRFGHCTFIGWPYINYKVEWL